MTDEPLQDEPLELPEEQPSQDELETEVRTVWEECISQLPDFDAEQSYSLALYIAQNHEILEQLYASIQAVTVLIRQSHPASLEEFYPMFIELYMACTSLPALVVYVVAAKDIIFNRGGRSFSN